MLHFVETQRKWNKQKELNYKPDFWAKWFSIWRLFWAWWDFRRMHRWSLRHAVKISRQDLNEDSIIHGMDKYFRGALGV
jgi:hypothetical protein